MAKRILRLPEVLERTGETTTSWYAKMRGGKARRAFQSGRERLVGSILEIDLYIENMIAERDIKPAAKRKGGPGRGRKSSTELGIEAA